jgi:hypothetical protein
MAIALRQSTTAHAIVDLVDTPAARHLVTGLNRYHASVLATTVDHDHVLNLLGDFIQSLKGPISPELHSRLEALITDLERCAVCGDSKDATTAIRQLLAWRSAGSDALN